ncbi:helix-turn-helix domain-containing protein [Streptomyces laurentii]|uniref:helix-turn-helix domain-containing protein n=1 Tax=Streptomyces laurentii TaxID=39478 RepID=UPI0036AFC995
MAPETLEILDIPAVMESPRLTGLLTTPEGRAPHGFDLAAVLPAPRGRAYRREPRSRTLGDLNGAADVPAPVPDGVPHGRVRVRPLSRVRSVAVAGDRQDLRRTRLRVPRGERHRYVVVELLEQGVARLEQDGRTAVLGPGDIVVYDLGRPVRLDLPEPSRTKSVILPKDVLGLKECDLARLTARRLPSDTPLAGLLSPFLCGFVDGAGTYPPRVVEVLARGLVDLLGVLNDEVAGRTAAAEEPPHGNRALRLRIQAFIDRRLADPELTPQAIARAHHISVRYLHKLFENEDATVNRWIQRRRLDRSRRDLALHRNVTIAAVAHQWGFASAAHYSRVFRAAYGMSPREWRESGEASLAGTASVQRVEP